MTTSTIEAETKLSGADLHTSRSSASVDDLNNVDALCSLMKMYESGQILEEEEARCHPGLVANRAKHHRWGKIREKFV